MIFLSGIIRKYKINEKLKNKSTKVYFLRMFFGLMNLLKPTSRIKEYQSSSLHG